MKAKTLLIAAAALAATVISSEAQVYSQNVVGYVNVVTPAGANAAVANPLDLDGVDNITNVLASVPKGTTIQLWNGAGFSSVTYSLAGKWSSSAATTFIPPGVGFFIKTPSQFTNTFVGNVIPNFPGTNTLVLSGGVQHFIGSVLPVSGTITNAVDQGPDALNLGSSLPNGTVIQVWNGSGYTSATKNLATGKWNGNPTISIGQCFFVKPSSTTNWTQVLQ